MTARSVVAIPLIAAALLLPAAPAVSAEIKVLTAGAMKSVALALQGGSEAASGDRLVIDNDTAGGLTKRIEAGEAFDMAIITPNAIGSSGIYVAGLLRKLGIANANKPKERLQAGGYVAEKVAKGEAEIALQQISEILPVKGVTLAGPLPEEIQNYTVYATGLSVAARDPRAAQAWIDYLTGAAASAAIEARGMSRP